MSGGPEADHLVRVDSLPLFDLASGVALVEDIRQARSPLGAYQQVVVPGTQVAAVDLHCWSGEASLQGLTGVARSEVWVPSVTMVAIDGGCVAGQGHVLRPDGSLVLSHDLINLLPDLPQRLRDAGHPAAPSHPWEWQLRAAALRQRRRVAAEALFAPVLYIHNFGHSLLEMLPRIAVAQQLGLGALPLILPRQTPAFVLEMLSAAGVAPAQLRYFEPWSEVVSAGRLFLPGLPLRNGVLHPWCAAFFGRFAARFLPRSRGGGPRRFFLSRQRWEGRDFPLSLTNRAEVTRLLEGAGFATVFIEELPLAEQVRLFRDAEAIVAEDGSAAHGSIFSAPGTPLLILRSAERSLHYHLAVAALRRQRLGVVDGEPLPGEGGRDDARPYRLPLPRLATALQAFFRV